MVELRPDEFQIRVCTLQNGLEKVTRVLLVQVPKINESSLGDNGAIELGFFKHEVGKMVWTPNPQNANKVHNFGNVKLDTIPRDMSGNTLDTLKSGPTLYTLRTGENPRDNASYDKASTKAPALDKNTLKQINDQIANIAVNVNGTLELSSGKIRAHGNGTIIMPCAIDKTFKGGVLQPHFTNRSDARPDLNKISVDIPAEIGEPAHENAVDTKNFTGKILMKSPNAMIGQYDAKDKILYRYHKMPDGAAGADRIQYADYVKASGGVVPKDQIPKKSTGWIIYPGAEFGVNGVIAPGAAAPAPEKTTPGKPAPSAGKNPEDLLLAALETAVQTPTSRNTKGGEAYAKGQEFSSYLLNKILLTKQGNEPGKEAAMVGQNGALNQLITAAGGKINEVYGKNKAGELTNMKSIVDANKEALSAEDLANLKPFLRTVVDKTNAKAITDLEGKVDDFNAGKDAKNQVADSHRVRMAEINANIHKELHKLSEESKKPGAPAEYKTLFEGMTFSSDAELDTVTKTIEKAHPREAGDKKGASIQGVDQMQSLIKEVKNIIAGVADVIGKSTDVATNSAPIGPIVAANPTAPAKSGGRGTTA